MLNPVRLELVATRVLEGAFTFHVPARNPPEPVTDLAGTWTFETFSSISTLGLPERRLQQANVAPGVLDAPAAALGYVVMQGMEAASIPELTFDQRIATFRNDRPAVRNEAPTPLGSQLAGSARSIQTTIAISTKIARGPASRSCVISSNS